MSSSPALRTRPLPEEILETIIEGAWRTLAQTADRWALYHALARVNDPFRRIVCAAALRNIVVVYPDQTELILLREVGSAWAALHSSWPEEREFEERVAARRALFARSHVDLDVTTLLQQHGPYLGRFWAWRDFFATLHGAIPNCTSFALTCRAPIDARILHDTLFPVLTAFPSLTRLRLANGQSGFHSSEKVERLPPLPNVTHLRLTRIPRCQCVHPHHDPTCLPAFLLVAFPRLQHLHLETPIFLKRIPNPPHTMHTLTLDAPPARPRSSVLEYGVGPGLRSGFFAWALNAPGLRRLRRRPKVVVWTGAEDPAGLAQARTACAQYGVEFERVEAFQ